MFPASPEGGAPASRYPAAMEIPTASNGPTPGKLVTSLRAEGASSCSFRFFSGAGVIDRACEQPEWRMALRRSEHASRRRRGVLRTGMAQRWTTESMAYDKVRVRTGMDERRGDRPLPFVPRSCQGRGGRTLALIRRKAGLAFPSLPFPVLPSPKLKKSSNLAYYSKKSVRRELWTE